MRKLIAWLYNKLCRQEIKTLYVGAIQRDFSKELNVQEEKRRNLACLNFVSSGACDIVFNEILGDYVEKLFSLGESQEARDILHNNINVIVRVEDRIKSYANAIEEEVKNFDPNEPL